MRCSHTICEALGMQVTGGPCPQGKNFSFLGCDSSEGCEINLADHD